MSVESIKQLIIDVLTPYTQTIRAVQNDTHSRYLLITVTSGSIPINLTGASAKIYAIKPDGTEVFNNCEIADVNGVIRVGLTTQMLTVAGNVRAEITLTDSDPSILSSIPFNITVAPSIRNDTSIESADEYTAWLEALATTEGLDGRITTVDNRVTAVQNSIPPFATQAEAEAGENNTKIMSPLRVKQQSIAEAAAQVPTVSGSAAIRDLTVPAGANTNRLTILLSSAVTATSVIRLRVGTGPYYNVVMPNGDTESVVKSLSAYVPYDLVLAYLGDYVWVCLNQEFKFTTVTVQGNAGTNNKLYVARQGAIVTVSMQIWVNFDTTTSGTVVGTMPQGFRPRTQSTEHAVTLPIQSDTLGTCFGLVINQSGSITFKWSAGSRVGNPGSVSYIGE